LHSISPETQAILLLCGVLPGREAGEDSPLTISEYHRLNRWLQSKELSPSSLLDDGASDLIVDGIAEHSLNCERVKSLLSRGTAVALATERWLQMGLWIISAYDKSFPPLLIERLADKCAPLLFGAGSIKLLSEGGLAVVGSRNADETALEFANRAGERCAEERFSIISGGARGIDAAAMGGALEAGGNVVGVLANNLARQAVSPESRLYLQDSRLTLLSPVSPEAHFHPGNAMARNKYIYALADFALVVASDHNSGGTWNGAVENLKYSWSPLFVREAEDIPEGNRRLLRRETTPLTSENLASSAKLVEYFISHSPQSSEDQQTGLFDQDDEG
jgi:predicted Rossmann fold nucleotide-binding protein DprA/Smf involved in DNA uptake